MVVYFKDIITNQRNSYGFAKNIDTNMNAEVTMVWHEHLPHNLRKVTLTIRRHVRLFQLNHLHQNSLGTVIR